MFWLSAALADCMMGSVATNQTDTAGTIVLDLYGGAESIPLVNPRLVQGKTRVPLQIVSKRVGFNQTQVVLRASGSLPTGSVSLLVDGTHADYGMAHRGGWTFESYGKPLSWTVVEPAAVSWPGEPTLGKTDTAAFGCGPARTAEIDVAGATAPWFEVSLSDGKRIQTAWVPAYEGKLFVGHGMCGGEFDVTGDVSYAVSVGLVAHDGSVTDVRKLGTVRY